MTILNQQVQSIAIDGMHVYLIELKCSNIEMLNEKYMFILRLADALIVMDSRLVIRVENMVTTSSLEVVGVDLNSAMSKYLQLSLLVLLVLTYFLHFPSSEYVNTIKRLCRKLLYMYMCSRQGECRMCGVWDAACGSSSCSYGG